MTSTYTIGDELIDLCDKVLVAVDARKRACLNACFVRQVADKMCGALVNDTLHSQLPCGEVNVFYLWEKTFVVQTIT
jgi:hypothetical protein